MNKIKWRRYTSLPPSIEPLIEGTYLKDFKPIYPTEKDFTSDKPWIIWDSKEGKVIRSLTEEEYHKIFGGVWFNL